MNNSGLWLDYKFQQPEDQVKFCLPLNRDTENLYYNTYLVIDANVITEPRVFQISKINRSVSKGIAVFTATQELANQHTLKADYDADGNVVAWWADWYSSPVSPEQGIPTEQDASPSIVSKIICSGKQQIRIGGSAKTFTVNYYEDGKIIEKDGGLWNFYIDNKEISDLLELTLLDQNKVKVKANFTDDYIGKVLKVRNTSGDIVTELDVEILAL